MITLLLLYSIGAHNAFICENGGGGGSVELSLRFIISSPTWPVLCFSVMSDLNLDNPGFQSQGAPPPTPPSSGSSSDSAADRRTCLTCHRWLRKKSFDRHTLCISCRGCVCDIEHRIAFPILSPRLELLASQVSTLSQLLTARLAAPQAFGDFPCLSRSQLGSARVRHPLPSSCRDC